MANTVLASVVAGANGDPRGADRSGWTRRRCRSRSCPPLPQRCSPASRHSGSRAVAGLLIGIAQSLVFYASTLSWFPTDKRQPAARHAGAPDVRHHRARALPARRQPADEGRAGREAAAGGAETGAVPSAERPLHRARRAAADRAAVRLPPGADAVPDRDRWCASRSWSSPDSSARYRSRRWRWLACPGSWCRTSS